MSVLIYAHRYKCDVCGAEVDVKPAPGQLGAPSPDGWLHFRDLPVGNLIRPVDLCAVDSQRPLADVMRALGAT